MKPTLKQKISDLNSKIKYFLLLGLLWTPFLAKAQTNQVQTGLQNPTLWGLFGTNGGGLAGSTSLTDLIANVIRLMLVFAGAIAIFFVIIGGYQYVTSAGNEEQAEKGQKTLINAIIGVIVIILSYMIITVISNLVSSSTGYGF